MVETWKSVIGFDAYEVSDLGNVKSWLNGRWGRLSTPKLLYPTLMKIGYYSVMLSNGRASTRKYIHNLVLEAFVGPRPIGLHGLHGIGGTKDNSLNNLYWGTLSQNNGEDKRRDGTDNRGEKHPLRKLNNDEVLEIRKLLSLGYNQTEIAIRFDVGPTVINKIVHGKLWRHVA